MSTKGPVRVLLVEDHAATRAALRDTLGDFAQRVQVVAELPDAESLLGAPGKSTPDVPAHDVALVDLALPGMSGAELIRTLASRPAPVRCLALTAFGDEANVVETIRAGAFGYLLKDESAARLVHAIEEAAAGEHPISSRVAGFLFMQARTRSPWDSLTGREEELARTLAEGLTYAECAQRMGVALGTVQDYVKRLYRKLDVSSKKEVREWVARHPGRG